MTEKSEGQRSEGVRIARNSALIAGGEIVSLALGFVTTILITDCLGDDYGLLIGAQRFVAFFLVIVQFGLYPLLVRAFASRRGDAGILLGTTLLLRAILGLVFALAVAVSARVLDYLPEARWLLLALVALEFLGVISEVYVALCEGFERMGRSALIAMSRSISIFIGVVAVTVLGGGLAEFVSIYLLGRAVQVIAAVTLARGARPQLKLRVRLGYIIPLLREAVWFAAVGLVATAQASLAVMVLTKISTTAETARFGAALNFVSVVLLLPVLTQRALLPAFSRLSQTGGATAVAHNGLRVIPAGLVPAGAGLALLADPVVALYPSGEFADAAPVLRLMAFWLVVSGPSFVAASFLTGLGRLRALVVVHLFGLFVQALFLTLLIPPYGAVGAALAVLVCFTLTAAAMVGAAAQRGAPIPWVPWLRIAIATLVMGGAVYSVRAAPLVVAVCLGAFVYAATLFVSLPRDSVERGLLDQAVARWRQK